MIGQIVSLGLGSPAAIDRFILVGLSPNPEVRDAEVLLLVGSYGDATITGTYESTRQVVAAYAPNLPITGSI